MLTVHENYIEFDSDKIIFTLSDKDTTFELDVSEGDENRFTGQVFYHDMEKKNSALMAVEFDGCQMDEKTSIDCKLMYSDKVGAFKYLVPDADTSTFDITVKIPSNVTKIKVTLKPWYNQYDVQIAKFIFFQKINPKAKKVFESCKQVVLSTPDDLKIFYDEPVLYRYIGENWPFEFLAHFKTSSEKLVVFGTSAIKENISLPVFQRHTQLSQIPESCLIVHDPTLYINRKIVVGWYQGNHKVDIFSTFVKLLQSFLDNLLLENDDMLFYGSSASGFFSLRMAGAFKDSIAFVINPQTNVLNYNKNFVTTLLQYAFEEISIKEAEKKFIERMSIMEYYKTLDFFPNIWYKQNRVDIPHYNNHLRHFLDFYLDDNVSKKNMIVEYFSDDRGYGAISDLEEMNAEIKHAFQYFSLEQGTGKKKQKPETSSLAADEYVVKMRNETSQIESLTGLYATLDIKVPLPPMRGWAISPDFARLLANEIFMKKPDTIVELGSGVSTLISAYALRKLKHGKVVSFDHDVNFGAATTENISLHELDGLAQVHHAPISEIMFGETAVPWYTISEEAVPEKIDMLIVDGPPARTAENARYPALPFFFDRLAEDAVVIMDDGIRQEEKEICRRWLEEYPELESEYVETEKGAFILRRKKSHRA